MKHERLSPGFFSGALSLVCLRSVAESKAAAADTFHTLAGCFSSALVRATSRTSCP